MNESWDDLLRRVYLAGYDDRQHERDFDPKSAKVVHTAKIRADLLEQHIRELESALAELAEWARDIAGDCDDPAKSEQEDEMIERINKILEQPR